MPHPCPIKNCTRQAKDQQLMCWPHWRRVPRSLNHAVFDTFRNSASWKGGREAYQQARAAAISSVETKEEG